MRHFGNIRFWHFFLLAVLCAGGLTVHAQQENAAKLKPLVDAYVKVWNSGNVDELSAIMSPDFKRHADPTAESSAEGIAALQEVIKNARTTFPDFQVSIDEAIYGDGKVAVRWSYSGTHSGAENELLKGKKVQNSGISVVHVTDGKMVEEWAAWDNLHTMMQLGMKVVPQEAEEDDD